MNKRVYHTMDRADTPPGSNGNGSLPAQEWGPGARPLADRHRDALQREAEKQERKRNRTPLAQRFDTVAKLMDWVKSQEEKGEMHLETFQQERKDEIALVGDIGLLKRCYIQHGRDTNDYNPKWKAITETSIGKTITLTLWREDIDELVWPDRLSGANEHTWTLNTDRYHPDDSPPNLDIEFVYVMNSKLQLRADPLPEEMRERV